MSSFQKGQVVIAGRILLLVDCFPIGLLVKRCSKIHQGPRTHLSNLNKRVKILLEVELLKKKDRGLGLSIVGKKSGPGVFISEVVKGNFFRSSLAFAFLG